MIVTLLTTPTTDNNSSTAKQPFRDHPRQLFAVALDFQDILPIHHHLIVKPAILECFP